MRSRVLATRRVRRERLASWAGIGGWLFCAKLAALSKLNGIEDQNTWPEKFGPRWAYQIQKFMKVFPLSFWATAFHALAYGMSFAGIVEDLSKITDLQIDRETEIRCTRLHGKSFAWYSLVAVEPGWIERGRNIACTKRLSPKIEKVEWVDVTEMRGDEVVSKSRVRLLT
jgi:hypothetical protein